MDKITYRKDLRIPYNPDVMCGYHLRTKTKPVAIIIHTTNGKHGTSLSGEANFLANSRDVSAHYLIGKQGQMIEFLDPSRFIAWHVGCTKNDAQWGNEVSIGIEIHHTPSEGRVNEAQRYATTKLVQQLMQQYNIPAHRIETHRAVAVYCKGHPLAGRLGRKVDPSGWSDAEFYAWRETLTKPQLARYRVTNPRGVYIRQSPQVNSTNIAGTLEFNDTFIADSINLDELGQVIGGTNKWAHIMIGETRGVSVNDLGFVHVSNLELIEMV